MVTFVYLFSVAYVGATLAGTGLVHLTGLASFQATVVEHGILPRRLSGSAAVALVGFELATGMAAVVTLTAGAAVPTLLVPAAGAVAGGTFLVYLRRLLRAPRRASTCGCTPISAGLSRASLAPAFGLLVMGAAGLVAGSSRPVRPLAAGVGLPIAAGVALAALVVLLPLRTRTTPGRGGSGSDRHLVGRYLNEFLDGSGIGPLPRLLLFLSTGCDDCDGILGALRSSDWTVPTVVVWTDGSAPAAPIRARVIPDGRTIAAALGIRSVPHAIILSDTGQIVTTSPVTDLATIVPLLDGPLVPAPQASAHWGSP